MYDDDDDDDDDDNKYGCTNYEYAYGDSFNMNDPSVRLQFKSCLQTYRNRKERIDTHKKYTQATPKASSQQKHPSKNTHKTCHHPTSTICHNYCF